MLPVESARRLSEELRPMFEELCDSAGTNTKKDATKRDVTCRHGLRFKRALSGLYDYLPTDGFTGLNIVSTMLA